MATAINSDAANAALNASERRGRGMPQLRYAQRLLQLLESAVTDHAFRAGREMLRDFRAARGVQLVVQVGVQQGARFKAIHGEVSSPVNSFARRSRARASRDITVPIFNPVIEAISL